jgi:TonB-dependent starch-binding outer membrane protein SusC
MKSDSPIKQDRNSGLFKLPGKLKIILPVSLLLLVLGPRSLSAQENKLITLKAENTKVTEVMQQVEGISGFKFFYDAGLINPDAIISVDLQDASLDNSLTKIFAGLDITWELQDRFIVLKKKPLPQNNQQSFISKGKVTDENGIPLMGVTVFIKASTKGTITGISGEFEIEMPAGGGTLSFRFLGMKEQEITVTDASPVSVILEPELFGLDEVVTIGYGVQKKRDLTGAVSVVDVNEMKKVKVSGIGEALQGQIAGISVITTGDPGSMAEVRVRGVGSFSNVGPLYVIDGLILNDANHINTADIESVQILKDASSSAIYGARGANGVIIITTKKGKEGPAKVSFTASQGWEELAKKVQMMDSRDFLYYNQLSYINAGAEWMGKPADSTKIPSTDWQNAIFQMGKVSDYNLNVTGGGKNSSYLIGGGYFSQDGVLKGPFYDRYTFRVNSEGTQGKVTFGENLSFIRTNQKLTNTGASSFANALSMPPVIPVRDPDEISQRGGYGYGSVNYPTYSTNPVGEQESVDDRLFNNRLLGNIYGEWTIIKGLKYKANLGIDFWYGLRKQIDHAYTIRYLSVETRRNDRLWQESQERMSLLNEHTLSYTTSFGKSKLDAMVGFTSQDNKYDYLANEGYNQKVNGLWEIDLVSVQNNMWGSEQENRMLSYLGRLNYDYDARYLFQFNIRRDGSSKFGPNTRWGTFPSASLGWRISNESFFEPVKHVISDLKLRASYGVLGDMQTLGNYDYQATINHSGPYEGYYAVLGSNQTVREGALQSNRVNPDLKWETKTTLNIGLDFGILNNMVYGSAEYFDAKSTDLLVSLPLAMATGVGVDQYLGDAVEWTNYGQMKNSGVELTLGYKERSGDFKYSIFANFTTLRNKVLKLGSAEGYVEGWYNQVNRTEEGRSIADFYLIKTNGIFQSTDEVLDYTTRVLNTTSGEYETLLIQPNAKPGDIRYVDYNKDGKIDLSDRQWLGSPLPKFETGINFSAEYKGFDLTVFFNSVFGNKIFNGVRIGMEAMDAPNNMPAGLNPWTVDHPSKTTPRPYFGPNDNVKAQTDRWLENGSFIRVKNLQLGYSLPENLLRKTGFLENFRVYVSGQNLITLTAYKGYDPELMSSGPFVQGCDIGGYPPVRSFMTGIQISF